MRRHHEAAFRKGSNHVEDCFPRPRDLHRLFRSLHGLARSRADGQRTHLGPQWRPAPLRPVRLRLHYFCAASPRKILCVPPDDWPRISGAVFFVCVVASQRGLALPATFQPPRLLTALIACRLAYRIPKCANGNASRLNRKHTWGGQRLSCPRGHAMPRAP